MKGHFIAILSLVFASTLFAQETPYGSTSYQFEIQSETQQTYTLNITLPKDFDESKTYNALYYLDAWWLSESVLGAYTLLNQTAQVEDVVLIGIGVNGSLLDWNKQRTMDFTPSPYNMPITQYAGTGENAIPLDSTTTGGANEFLAFLSTTVFDFVHQNYPNLSTSRGLLGHSFGGLFACYVLKNEPELFSNYILISPAIWWNKPELLQKNQFEKLASIEQPVKLFLAFGEEEVGWITKSSTVVDGYIRSLEKENLTYTFAPYPKSNHNSVLPRAIYDAIRFVYQH